MLMRKATHNLFCQLLKTGVTGLILTTFLASALSGCSLSKENPSITLATTTSVDDSGLLAYLQPDLEKDTGLQLKIVAQGTGQAIKTAESGDADVLLVHDPKSEEKFIADSHGKQRIPFMYNYFVIAGPSDDPAQLKNLKGEKASKTLQLIMEKKAPFVSRGDDSGTHKKELSLWKALDITPFGEWYISAGKGMGAVLSMASEKKAYVLTDKATFLSMHDKLDLEILLEDAADLKNQYSILEISTEKHPDINKAGAEKFIKWMTSQKTLDKIAEFGKDKYGESLFQINYEEK